MDRIEVAEREERCFAICAIQRIDRFGVGVTDRFTSILEVNTDDRERATLALSLAAKAVMVADEEGIEPGNRQKRGQVT
jgi:hypothetical protein